MNFSWQQLLEIAEELYLQRAGDEDQMRLRSSINRAYYAAHMTLRRHLETYKKEKFGKSAHEALIEVLIESADEQEQILGRSLDMLFQYRKYADYSDEMPKHFQKKFKSHAQLAEQALFLSREILATLSKLKSSS